MDENRITPKRIETKGVGFIRNIFEVCDSRAGNPDARRNWIVLSDPAYREARPIPSLI
jgi:hypothetical protein